MKALWSALMYKLESECRLKHSSKKEEIMKGITKGESRKQTIQEPKNEKRKLSEFGVGGYGLSEPVERRVTSVICCYRLE